jgi:hypothetical protein
MKCRYRRYVLASARREMVTAATHHGFAEALAMGPLTAIKRVREI